MKMLPELFDHPDANVRACAKGLTIELCRWIGKDAVKNLLFDKMRDTMVSLAVQNLSCPHSFDVACFTFNCVYEF